MVLWLLVFTVFRASIWRVGMYVLDVASEDCIPLYVQAALTLGLDTSMLMGTVLILKRSLAQFRPLREKGLFPLRLKGNWWATVLLSCLCIPAIDWLGAKMLVRFCFRLHASVVPLFYINPLSSTCFYHHIQVAT